jgi:osmotically-inducible protein OsmY
LNRSAARVPGKDILMKALVLGLLVVAASCSNNAQEKVTHSDAYLAVVVKSRLATIDIDSTTAVDVSVAHGAVTLSGQARAAAERAAYVHAASTVDGVTSVADRLGINPHLRGLREQTADAALAGRVSAAIAAQAGVNVFKVKVSAQRGVVTLSGTVPRESIARTIGDTVRSVGGVKDVIDRITVHS